MRRLILALVVDWALAQLGLVGSVLAGFVLFGLWMGYIQPVTLSARGWVWAFLLSLLCCVVGTLNLRALEGK